MVMDVDVILRIFTPSGGEETNDTRMRGSIM